MLEKIYSLLGIKNNSAKNTESAIDTNEIVKNIRVREENDIPQGKQIYSLEYKEFTLSLDREFTGQYRISVFVGNHKVYGFSIMQKQISDEQFEMVLNQILSFLAENPSIETMPDTDLLKSHFFGNP